MGGFPERRCSRPLLHQAPPVFCNSGETGYRQHFLDADGTISQQDLHTLAESAGVSTEIAQHYAPLVALFDALLERRLDELEIKAKSSAPVPLGGVAVRRVQGIDPHALITTSALAERWGMEADSIRRIDEEALPRAPWKGGGIRYRGADVLRFEGVSEEEINGGARPSNVTPILPQAPSLPEASPSPSRLGRRPKAGTLPKL